MKRKISLLFSLLSACYCLSAVHAQNGYQVPRTEYGQPDIQGVWNFSSNTPLQRPREFADKEFLSAEDIARLQARREAALANSNGQAVPESTGGVGGYNDFWVESAGIGENQRTSLIIYPENGRLPATQEGVQIQYGGLGPDVPGTRPVRYTVGGIAKDGPEDRGLSERCIVGFNSGPPFVPSLYNNNVQIFQGRDHVVILTEMIHDARIVPLDGRPQLTDEIRQWSGDSRGYWEGDTLVVETRNFNHLTQSFGVAGSAYDKTLIERFTRTAFDTLNYEFTIDDSTTFKDKITALVPMTKVAGLLYEYACHEGNYGMVNILRGARFEESQAAEDASR